MTRRDLSTVSVQEAYDALDAYRTRMGEPDPLEPGVAHREWQRLNEALTELSDGPGDVPAMGVVSDQVALAELLQDNL